MTNKYLTANTIEDFHALTRILKTHTHAGILISHDITSIRALTTVKKCMSDGCENMANFAISQVFSSGKHYTYYLCKEHIKEAFTDYVDEIINKIDEAVKSVEVRKQKIVSVDNEVKE